MYALRPGGGGEAGCRWSGAEVHICRDCEPARRVRSAASPSCLVSVIEYYVTAYLSSEDVIIYNLRAVVNHDEVCKTKTGPRLVPCVPRTQRRRGDTPRLCPGARVRCEFVWDWARGRNIAVRSFTRLIRTTGPSRGVSPRRRSSSKRASKTFWAAFRNVA